MKNSSYRYYGILRNGMEKIEEIEKYLPDICESEECKGIYHHFKKGYMLEGDNVKFEDGLTLREKALRLGIRMNNLSDEEIRGKIESIILFNKNLRIYENQEEIELGDPIFNKIKVKKYKVIDIKSLKEIVKNCKKEYLKDKRTRKKKKKGGKEYG